MFLLLILGVLSQAQFYIDGGPLAATGGIQSRSYELIISAPHSTRHCTVTAVLFQGHCRLLSNYHCVRSSEKKQFSIQGSPPPLEHGGRMFGELRRSVSANLVGADPGRDLAELKLQGGQDQLCKKLWPLTASQTDWSNKRNIVDFRLANVGYFQGRATFLRAGGVQSWNYMDLSQPMQWVGSASGSVTEVKSGLSRLDHFLKLTALESRPSMSGGAVVDQYGILHGIISRFVPLEMVSLIIPARDVVAYLSEPIRIRPEDGYDQLIYSRRGGYNRVAAENLEKDAGGENVHSDGDSKGEVNGFLKSGIHHEGVTLNGQQVIAINNQPINGFNDLQRLFGQPGPTLLRDGEGYPPLEIRKNILKRISGLYFAPEGQSYLRNVLPGGFAIVPDQIYGNKTKMGATPLIGHTWHTIEIDEESITFWRRVIGIQTVLNAQVQAEPPFIPMLLAASLRFKGDDYKTLIMDPGQPGLPVLSCENRNFMRLVCTGPEDVFVFGILEDKSPRTFEFRWIQQLRGGTLIEYGFGDSVTEIPDTGKKK